MATIVTRAGKGSALTWTEGDANITNLNNDKLEAGPALSAALYGFTTTATAGGVTTLTNTSSVYQLFTGTGVQTIRLPDTSTLALGWSFHIVHNGSVNSLTLQTSAGTNLIGTIPPGTTVMATVISTANNTTAAWEAGFTDFAAVTGSGSVVLNTSPSISGGTINNTSIGTTTAAAGRFTALTTTNTTASIVSETNGNIAIQPNGTGQTVVKNLEYNENVFSLGTISGTIAPDAANGNVQTITLNGNLTINAFTNPISGQTITLVITTGGTGRTLSSTMLFAGGSKVLSVTSTVDILTISYIGTTYYASLVKDYF